MTTAAFRFDLFDPTYKTVLTNCSYMNLPFDIPNVYQEVNFQLTKCGEFFFHNAVYPDFDKLKELCKENAKVVLDIAWEKLNTGHWKDVDLNWRYAISFASLFKVLCLLLDTKAEKLDIIKACDMGFLMGAPIMQNILSKIASKVSSMLPEEENDVPISGGNIQVKKAKTSNLENLQFPIKSDKIDFQSFKNIFVKNSEPVKIVESIKNWPALKLWSVEYIFKKIRYRTVPVEIGSKYTDDSWTQKLMSVEDFVYDYIENRNNKKEVGYLAQHNLFDQVPELFDDIIIPSYITEIYGDVDVDVSVYFGPSGTISPLHFDAKYNLLAQVIGKKYIRLYSKETTDFLYPRHNTWLSNTSQVDVENPDLEAFPLFKNAPYKECILYPGDLLYIPPGCWHYVRSLSVSLSISFWWEIPEGS